jgi:hypothetical protein
MIKNYLYIACIIIINFVLIQSMSLEYALLKDMFPSSSEKCNNEPGQANYSYEFDPSWSNSSEWDLHNAPFEKDVFLVEFGHTEANANRTWKVRIGKGGNIYSYVAEYGEAMPPQVHEDGPFQDEVWQQVATNLALHNDTEKNFIHQAGTYQNIDALRKNPFFSPTVAKHCDDEECMFSSWGQHAHIPTNFYSNLLYYTRIRDCNNG